MSDEDAKLLKYSGLMGHPVTAVTGEPGARHTAGEFNTIAEAVKYIGAPNAHLTCYTQRGSKPRKWCVVYDQNSTDRAAAITPNDPTKPAPK